MNFKVGDIVRFKSADYVPKWHRLTNAEYCAAFGYSLSETYEVESVGSGKIVCEGIGWNVPDRFELAEQPKQPEPQVGMANFRKAMVELISHYGMVYKVNGYVKEVDLELSGQDFLKIYKEPKTESEFTMIKTSSILGIYAEGELK